MLFQLIDQKIRQAFSDAAMYYDVLTSLHKEIGRELVKKIVPIEQNGTILDIGMGTGWLTNKIKFYFPTSKVVGLDFAEGMIERAKDQNEGFDIIQADANVLPFRDNTFDIIISNLSFQWIQDLPQAFRLCHSTLRQDGALVFTMFGYHTFDELFISLEKTQNNGGVLPIHRLVTDQQVLKALQQSGFQHVKVDYERIKVRFVDMMSLVKWIKNIGANGLPKEIFVGKEWLNRASDYYEEHFKDRLGIYSTFEVIWCEAEK